MKTVTYRGPVDPHDPTTRFRQGKQYFPKDVPVKVKDDVAAELAELEKAERHTFEITDAEAGDLKASPEAVALAEEKGIDLAELTGSGKDGAITVNDVRAAAEAAAESQEG